MRTSLSRAAILAVVLCGAASFISTAMAAEEDPGRRGDQLQRLQRRINELAQRQEQIAQHMEQIQMAHPQPTPQTGFGPQGPNHMGTPNIANPGSLPVHPERVAAPGMIKNHKGFHDLMGLVFLGMLISNILLAVWIYTDIRKRGEGSGIFIALALVAGIPAAIIYSLVRIADKKP
jgi:hypothetical protein